MCKILNAEHISRMRAKEFIKLCLGSSGQIIAHNTFFKMTFMTRQADDAAANFDIIDTSP